MSHFIITHQYITWKIPFKHTVIGVVGYEPVDGIAAKNLITAHHLDDLLFAMGCAERVGQKRDDRLNLPVAP